MNRNLLHLPRLVQLGDYHECEPLQAQLRELVQHNLIKVKEVGFDGSYVAVVYWGTKPTKTEINELAKKQGIEFLDFLQRTGE